MSLLRPEEIERSARVAVRYLRAGVRSSRQLRAHLKARGVHAAAVNGTIAHCRRRGLLDDRAGARLWVEHLARQGYAAAGIRLKLTAKEFGEREVDEALARLAREAGDEARARELLQRKRFISGQAGRAVRTLRARGFDDELIERIVNDPSGD